MEDFDSDANAEAANVILHFACNPLHSNGLDCVHFTASSLILVLEDVTLNQRVVGSSPTSPTIPSLAK